MPITLRDIAREVGVSVTTVSRALAGYDDVAEETRTRVQATATQLGYAPNLTARRLQKRRTDTLGFIMPTTGPRFSDPFFSEIIAGIGTAAAAAEYDLLVSVHSPDTPEETAAYRRAAGGGWVDGLLVVRTREHDPRIKLLCEHDFPFVAFGRSESDYDFPYVDEDGAAGMRLLVEHFVERGHRRIAFVAPPAGLMFGQYRRRGFLQTTADHNLSVPPDWVVEGEMTQQSGAEAVERLVALDPRPTALICGNDLMAIGAMNRIQQHGFQDGIDVAVGGFDDIPLAAFVNPPLTTVHQPIYEIGRRICSMLVDIVQGKAPAEQHVLLKPSLVRRGSSGPVSTAP